MICTKTKYRIGQVVKHRKLPLRGVVYDVDACYSVDERYWEQLNEHERPEKAQPFYYILLEHSNMPEYMPEEAIEPDTSNQQLEGELIKDIYGEYKDGQYETKITLN